MAGKEGRGLVARTLFPWSQAVTYKQAWLRATAVLPLIFGFCYGLAVAGTALLGLPHLSLLTIVACSVFGCLLAALDDSRKVHWQRRSVKARSQRAR